MPSIKIDFNVNIDATGQIDVFGINAPTFVNIIAAHYKLPVNALYSSTTSGMIEFWEPSTQIGNIYASLASSSAFTNAQGVPAFQTAAKNMAKGLQRILVDCFNVSAASPFKNPNKYGDAYNLQRDFGRVALSCYTHYLFGHQAATAAITNDVAFIEHMLSISTGGQTNSTVEQRYAAWLHDNTVTNNVIQDWNVDESIIDAKLAIAITKKLVLKGLNSTDNTILVISAIKETTDQNIIVSNDTVANIVKQALGQDPSRAMSQDNNALIPDTRQILRFEAGDVVVVNIILTSPNVVVDQTLIESTTPSTAAYDIDTAEGGIQPEKYSILITLGDGYDFSE